MNVRSLRKKSVQKRVESVLVPLHFGTHSSFLGTFFSLKNKLDFFWKAFCTVFFINIFHWVLDHAFEQQNPTPQQVIHFSASSSSFFASQNILMNI